MTIDYTLYNAVKKKFSVQLGEALLISMIGDDIELFTARLFPGMTEEFWSLLKHHQGDHIPYAVFDHSEEGIFFAFNSRDFHQQENLTTGKVEALVMDPFGLQYEEKREALRQEMAELSKLLRGDAE